MIINLIVTTKQGKSFNKKFIYTKYKESSNDTEIDYYNLCDICNFELTKTIYSYQCPQNVLSKINQFVKKIGELKYCIYGNHGVIAYIKVNKKKLFIQILEI